MQGFPLIVVLLGALASGSASAAAAATTAPPVIQVSAPQGGVARWAGLAAQDCGIYGKRYHAVDSVCYYPIDIETALGRHEIALWDKAGKQHLGTVLVEKEQFPDVPIDLPPALNRFLDLSAADSARAVKETAEVAKVLRGSDDAPQFSLPLGKPAASLPRSANDFGSMRTFNGRIKSLHSGLDFPVNEGSPVLAVASGKVVLAADHFFTGNAVYIDHGDGLVSMYFHMNSLNVHTGSVVKRGQAIGTVGRTGRGTGPHLHIGMRWLGKRINPERLLEPPAKLPSASDSKATAEQKIRKADHEVPKEGETPLIDEG